LHLPAEHTSADKSLAQLNEGIRALHAIYNLAIPRMCALVSESTKHQVSAVDGPH
jgi:hypothetical protein